MKLLLATTNKHKIHEFRILFRDYPTIELITLNDLNINIEVVEDGNSFLENAIKKAQEYAKESSIITLAEDSGIEVEALDNAPGIYSARYAGENATDEENLTKLYTRMLDEPNRKARYCCCIVICNQNELLASSIGYITGRLDKQIIGSGFGYDPLFIPDNFEDNFAILGDEVKKKISHRKQAFSKIMQKDWWK